MVVGMGAYEADSLPEAELAQRLRGLRTHRRWSQADLAEHMSSRYGLRWHQTTVAKIEAGQRPIGLNEAAALARIFDITGTELLMPLTSREDNGNERPEILKQAQHRYDALEAELAHWINQQAAARTQVQRLSADRERAVQQMERLANELKRITEQYEAAQREHQYLTDRLDRSVTELTSTEHTVETLRAQHDFYRAELAQARAHRRRAQLQSSESRRLHATSCLRDGEPSGWAFALTFLVDNDAGAHPARVTSDWRWLTSRNVTASDEHCCDRPQKIDHAPIAEALIEKLADSITNHPDRNVGSLAQRRTGVELIVAVPVTCAPNLESAWFDSESAAPQHPRENSKEAPDVTPPRRHHKNAAHD